MSDQLLTLQQAAEVLQMSPSWLYKKTSKGQFPHIKVGRSVRFLHQDLLQWISAHRVDLRSSFSE